MDQSSQAKVNEGFTSNTPAAHAATTNQPIVMVSGAPPASAAFPSGTQSASVYPDIPEQLSDQHQIAFQQVQQLQHQHRQQHQQQLQAFWADQMAEIEQITEYKLHSLPLARIKKIMKADEDVRMIAGEGPMVFAKARKMFFLELTLRVWLHTEENKRRTLQKNDDGVGLPNTALQTMVPHYVPGIAIPFELYSNQQPIAFVWPQPEQ